MLSTILVLGLCGCGGDKQEDKTSEQNQNVNQQIVYDKNDLESILKAVETTYENAQNQIDDDIKDLLQHVEISYVDNVDKITVFYQNALSISENLNQNIETYSIDYFKCVASNGIKEYKVWNNAMKDFL